ncbi:Dam family site-specific DNA-(adenine-N6)-methyltransferase [Thiohalophilus sp.]|uniref:Dam family site-specific DNA-(adenine-N6)-methyltransferase n=1 Tax=Thiohalophilus sp. TaxID=3028392 RepID=UPI003A0FF962
MPRRPFLKWAGNKFRILEHIIPMLPEGKRLVEPFAGSAALFLNSDYDRYLLSDRNADLISLYNLLKQEGAEFIDYCAQYFIARNNQEKRYYRLREQFNACDEPHLRAALFIYLNRHGYNGLCRYNASGGFNVPFGRYKRPYFPQKEMLAFHHRAQRAEFLLGDFEQTMQQARPGDVIYCDPPYVPLSTSANFTTYSAGGFSLDDQQTLAELAQACAQRGVPVLISNHNTAYTRKIYKPATRRKPFQVQRYISCNGEKRNTAGEILALFK